MLRKIAETIIIIALFTFVYQQSFFICNGIKKNIFIYKEKQKFSKNIELLKIENKKYTFSMNYEIYKKSSYILSMNNSLNKISFNVNDVSFKYNLIKYNIDCIINYYCNIFKFLDKNKIIDYKIDIETKSITFIIKEK